MRNASYCRPVLLPDERLQANLEKLEKQKLFREALDMQVREASTLKNSRIEDGRKFTPKRQISSMATEKASADISPILSSSSAQPSGLISPHLYTLSPHASLPPAPPPLPPPSLLAKGPLSPSVGGVPPGVFTGTDLNHNPTTMRYRFSFEGGKGQFYPSAGTDTTGGMTTGTSNSGGTSMDNGGLVPPPMHSPPLFSSSSSERISLAQCSSKEEMGTPRGHVKSGSPMMNVPTVATMQQQGPSAMNPTSLAGSMSYALLSVPHSPLSSVKGEVSPSALPPHRIGSSFVSCGEDHHSGGLVCAGTRCYSPAGGGADLGPSFGSPQECSPKCPSGSSTTSLVLYPCGMRSGQAASLASENAIGAPTPTGEGRSPRTPASYDGGPLSAEGNRNHGGGGGNGGNGGVSATAHHRHLKTGAPKRQQMRHLPPLDGFSGTDGDAGYTHSFSVPQTVNGSKKTANGMGGGNGTGPTSFSSSPSRPSPTSSSSPSRSPNNALLTPIPKSTSGSETVCSPPMALPSPNEGESNSTSLTFTSASPLTPQEQALIDQMKMKERSWEEQVERLKEELRQARQQQEKDREKDALCPRKKILQDTPQLPRTAEVPSVRERGTIRMRSIRKGLQRSAKEDNGGRRGLSRGKEGNHRADRMEKTGSRGDTGIAGKGEGRCTGKEDEEKLFVDSCSMGATGSNRAEKEVYGRPIPYGLMRRAETAPEGGVLSDIRAQRRQDATVYPYRGRHVHGGRGAPLSPPHPAVHSDVLPSVDAPAVVDRRHGDGHLMVPHGGARNDALRWGADTQEKTEVSRKGQGGVDRNAEEVNGGSLASQHAAGQGEKWYPSSIKDDHKDWKRSQREESTPTKPKKNGNEDRNSPCSTDVGSTLLEHFGVDSSISSNSEDSSGTVMISFDHLLQFAEAQIITHQQSLQLWNFFMSCAVTSKPNGTEHHDVTTAILTADDEHDKDCKKNLEDISSMHHKHENNDSRRRSLQGMSCDEHGDMTASSEMAMELDEISETEMPSLPPSDGTPSLLFEYSMNSSPESGSTGFHENVLSDSALETSTSTAYTERMIKPKKKTKRIYHSSVPPSTTGKASALPKEKDILHHFLSPEGSIVDASMDGSTEEDIQTVPGHRKTPVKQTVYKKQTVMAQPEATLHHPALLNIMSASLRKKIMGSQPEKNVQGGMEEVISAPFSNLNQAGTTSLKKKILSNTRRPVVSKLRKEKKKKPNYQLSYLEKLLFASDDDLA